MMLVLLLCIVMKIAEISVGRTSPMVRPPPPPPTCDSCDRRCRRCRRCRRSSPKRRHHRQSYVDNRCISRKLAGEGIAVMEEPQTPGSDCNSNPAADSIQQDLVGSEFVQDNVEYQWFIDYGYRDGGLHIHPSVLSSLSASYTPKDLGYYDDLARNLDANLAEIDMESFRTADIHTLLTALPVMCTEPVQHSEFNYQREQYASMSGSVMEKLDIGSSISPHTSSQGEDSACSTADTISICKSSLLFSPVKETPMLPPGGSYSVDSLDCEDMLLTCQTNNKNNYTIAFEGSMTMYSDGSQDFENHDKHKTYESPDVFYDKPKDMKTMLDLSMACSDSKIYTTWSNLKHSSMNKVITRHPSGNNNTIPDISQSAANLTLGRMNKRSQSLPDLSRVREFQHINIPLNFSVDSAESSNHMQRLHSSGSAMSRSTNVESSDNGENVGTKKLQNLSLVRLFMKQKSMSVEGMSLTLDQSDSVSDNSGWPTSNSGSDSATNTNTQIQRQNGQDNICDRRVPENDFSINWIRRDVTNNRDVENQRDSLNVLKCAIRNKDDKVEMASSASVEELSESTSKSGCMSDQRSFDINNPFEQKNGRAGLMEKKYPICRTTGIQANAEMEDNAVQTSLIFAALREKHGFPLLQETTVNKKPVYVVYPNYTLPDLSFLKIKNTKFDNIALKPHTFDRNKMEWKRARSSRPFSCNDIDALRQRGFAHIKDWESLTFLLPCEYKKILHDVPEVSRYININEEVKRPLFCLSPPMRHKTRPISEIIPNTTSSTSSTATQPSSGYRGSSTILTDSSTNQQPLSNNTINPLYLYRYDSMSSEASLNNDKKMHRLNQTRQTCPSLPKRSVSLPQGEGESVNGRVPPRPPLPRSILRKNKVLTNKRYSMFEMGDVGEQSEESVDINKRMSLQEPYYMNNDLQLLCRERTIGSEKDVDETEAERYLKEKLNVITNNANVESETSQNSDDDIKQLEEYLKRSAISSQSSDGDIDNAEVKVRSYVRKFLALRMNKDPLVRNIDMGESQRKTVSFATHQRKKHLDAKLNNLNVVVNEQNHDQATEDKLIEFEEKKKMVSSVNRAVDLLLKYWNADSNHSRPNYNERNECAQICLSNLCPALYAIMSDGLKPHLNSTFGPITNSVWQVVEASSQQGPLTKTLNELVQRINGEDVITEGMLKFHAFVFGLLNLRALDAWFAYLCTRESILRKHYSNNSLFVAALANANVREIVDSLLYILNPLAFCPFHLDLLYQYRQLHNSFGNVNNHTMNAMSFRNADLTMKDLEIEETESRRMVSSPKKTRPGSCIAYNMDDKCSTTHKGDLQNAKKHFSAINPKAFYALDKLTSEDSEDYTDSLEHSPLNKKASKQSQSKLFNPDIKKSSDDNGLSVETKFKKLQEKWELIGKESNKGQPVVMTPSSPVRTFGVLGKSKIPRLLTSPVKQSNVAANIVGKSSKSPMSGISSLKKPANLPTTKTALKKPIDTKTRDVTRRTSRVDQDTLGVTRTHTARPSSLPYKSHGVMSNDKNLISPHRRAVSTSLPRPTVTTVSRTPVSKHPHKEVRTLTHRIPSDTGHLSFAEGEKLKVILEVDNKWLLCAKGDRRGLVPRACVRSVQT
ncbi:RUSC2 protein, partial [Pseudoatta argentina]